MNIELRAQHMETITDPKAIVIYDMMCDACEKREGGMTDADQMLCADIARAEQIKQMCLADITDRGLGRERSNGRQRYYAENKSCSVLRAFTEQQRKCMAELKLTPGSRKAAGINLEDDFDNF